VVFVDAEFRSDWFGDFAFVVVVVAVAIQDGVGFLPASACDLHALEEVVAADYLRFGGKQVVLVHGLVRLREEGMLLLDLLGQRLEFLVLVFFPGGQAVDHIQLECVRVVALHVRARLECALVEFLHFALLLDFLLDVVLLASLVFVELLEVFAPVVRVFAFGFVDFARI